MCADSTAALSSTLAPPSLHFHLPTLPHPTPCPLSPGPHSLTPLCLPPHRYSTPKGEVLDVMFRNIRHAFFQPAENDMITLLHFHLINPIMVGNKKTSDVQFYAEVMDVVQTLDGGRRWGGSCWGLLLGRASAVAGPGAAAGTSLLCCKLLRRLCCRLWRWLLEQRHGRSFLWQQYRGCMLAGPPLCLRNHAGVLPLLPRLTDAPAPSPRRSMYDPDEIEEEQAEREKRNKINNEFSAFVKRVQELWERDFSDIGLEFDVPFRELAFEGVPHRSTVKMLPTVNCLVGGRRGL
jgi:hypothetical protein